MHLQRPTSIQLLQIINWYRLFMNILHIIYQFITCQTLNEAKKKKKMRLKKKMQRSIAHVELFEWWSSSFIFWPQNFYRHFRMGTFERSQLMVLLFHNLWFQIFRYKRLISYLILLMLLLFQNTSLILIKWISFHICCSFAWSN